MTKKIVIKNDEIIPDTHAFIYKNKKYPIKFDYFKYASKYFLKHQNEIKCVKEINLLDSETEVNINLSDSTIRDFINFVQDKDILLNNENAFGLNYLSNQYEVYQLNNITSKYISMHESFFVFDFLIEYQSKSNKIDLSRYEEIISTHMEQYIEDERLMQLDLNTIYRIIKLYFKNEKENNKYTLKKVLDFLIKNLSIKGRSASIIFECVDFGEYRKEYLQILIDKYSNIFDFHYIREPIFKIYLKAEKEKKILKEEIEMIKKEKEQLILEINQIKEENQDIEEDKEITEERNQIIEEEEINQDMQKEKLKKWIIQDIEDENEINLDIKWKKKTKQAKIKNVDRFQQEILEQNTIEQEKIKQEIIEQEIIKQEAIEELIKEQDIRKRKKEEKKRKEQWIRKQEKKKQLFYYNDDNQLPNEQKHKIQNKNIIKIKERELKKIKEREIKQRKKEKKIKKAQERKVKEQREKEKFEIEREKKEQYKRNQKEKEYERKVKKQSETEKVEIYLHSSNIVYSHTSEIMNSHRSNIINSHKCKRKNTLRKRMKKIRKSNHIIKIVVLLFAIIFLSIFYKNNIMTLLKEYVAHKEIKVENLYLPSNILNNSNLNDYNSFSFRKLKISFDSSLFNFGKYQMFQYEQ